jgi:hypothetical protein
MDRIKSKTKKYQKALAEYVRTLAAEYNMALGNELTYVPIVDLQDNHFQLAKMGWHGHQFIFVVLMHFDISPETGNIWIQQNNTERLLDEELAKFDIPKKHLVLGFRPDYMRKHSEYAVA